MAGQTLSFCPEIIAANNGDTARPPVMLGRLTYGLDQLSGHKLHFAPQMKALWLPRNFHHTENLYMGRGN